MFADERVIVSDIPGIIQKLKKIHIKININKRKLIIINRQLGKERKSSGSRIINII